MKSLNEIINIYIYVYTYVYITIRGFLEGRWGMLAAHLDLRLGAEMFGWQEPQVGPFVIGKP